MGDLNNDMVLWMSLGAVLFSFLSLVGFAWKSTRGIEGLEKGKDTVPAPEENK